MTEDCKECGWNNNGNCLAYPDMCAEIDDCEHKQLKRLEQENNAYKQSEQEATEIIKELKEYSQRMENQRENYYKEYNKLRSALEEIRNDLKEVCKEECDYTKPKFCGDCDCRYGQILTRVNEVLR